jgi:hypothetical protein
VGRWPRRMVKTVGCGWVMAVVVGLMRRVTAVSGVPAGSWGVPAGRVVMAVRMTGTAVLAVTRRVRRVMGVMAVMAR